MRNLITLFVIVFSAVFCQAQSGRERPGPRLKVIDSTSFDFGSIPQGPNVQHVFEFVNSGTTPLIIHRAQTSGGPDLADFFKGPILPGKRGWIKYWYIPGSLGTFTKQVSIYSNAGEKNDSPTAVLKIKGIVIRSDDSTASH